MKSLTKITIKAFLISGLIYAGLTTVVDYLRGREIDIVFSIMKFLIFGCCISLVEGYKYKNREKTK